MGVSFGSLVIARRNYLGARCERCRSLDCASMCLLLKKQILARKNLASAMAPGSHLAIHVHWVLQAP